MSGYVHSDVTVVIPCYNQSMYVTDAVESILANSVRPSRISILLMDPKSWQMRTKLEAMSSTVHCSISEQRSLPAARNDLIKRVETSYVIPLDADDMLPPNFIRQVVKNLPADVVYVRSHTFGDYEEIWDNPAEVTLDYLKKDNNIPNTALIKVDAWRSVGGYNEMFSFGYEDWEFWLHLAKRGKKFKKCTSTHLLYRRHGETLLHEAIKRRSEVESIIHKLHADIYEVKKRATPILQNREVRDIVEQESRKTRKVVASKPASSYVVAPQPTIAIIIPCYGYSDYVAKAVLSAVHQTKQVKEIVVMLMDERSRMMKEGLEALGDNVRAIQTTQKLLPAARNVLIGISSSDYFIPLDADDQLPDTFIENISKHIGEADVVYVGSKYFGAEIGTWPPDITEEVNWDLLTTFRRSAFVCTALVKRSAWEDVGGYNDKLTAYEDMEFWLHLKQTGHTFVKCTTTHLDYRKHTTDRAISMLTEHNGAESKMRALRDTIMNIHSERYSTIPKIIHYVWMGDKPRPDAFIDTWRRHLGSDWIIKEWNESNFDIDSIPFLRQAYDAKKFGIAVDPIRATVLYQFGGVWMDTDVIMTRDPSPFLQYDFFASYESEQWLNVGTLGVRPGLSIMRELMQLYQTVTLPATTDEFTKEIGTGPMTITRLLEKHIGLQPDGFPCTISHNDTRYRIEHAGAFCLNDEPNGAYNYTQHLYSASWMDEPASSWATTVRQSYERWKRKNKIEVWKG